MTIIEMHKLFRDLGQRMGLQQVRAILPQQIDNVLNVVINDTVNSEIAISISDSGENNKTNKLANSNILASLYKIVELDADYILNTTNPNFVRTNKFDKILTLENNVAIIEDCRFFVDMSVNYTPYKDNVLTNGEYVPPHPELSGINATKLFPIRVIEERYLSSMINDDVLKPAVHSPICVIHSGTSFKKYTIYFDNITSSNPDRLVCRMLPYKFRFSYYANPKIVKLDERNSANNVNCDLPIYTHVDIVKAAVDIYNKSLNGNASREGEAN